jgi:hypothetical protein
MELHTKNFFSASVNDAYICPIERKSDTNITASK